MYKDFNKKTFWMGGGFTIYNELKISNFCFLLNSLGEDMFT